MAYEAGLQSDPSSDVCKKGLAEVEKAMDNDADGDGAFSPGGDMGLGKAFSDPQMVRKLENHPKTGPMMKDPAFAAKIRQMQAGGGRADLQGMLADPRMLTVLGVLMGIDIVGAYVVAQCSQLTGRQSAMERPEGSDEMAQDVKPSTPSQSSSSRPARTPAPDPTPSKEKKPAAKEEPVDEPMVVDDSDATAKKQAENLKAKGNVAYKARNFDEAVESYQKAWDTWPKDVAFLTNLSGE